jgi:hypothetical protein
LYLELEPFNFRFEPSCYELVIFNVEPCIV